MQNLKLSASCLAVSIGLWGCAASDESPEDEPTGSGPESTTAGVDAGAAARRSGRGTTTDVALRAATGTRNARRYRSGRRGRATGRVSCNALLGFGLPEADGKSFVDRLWMAQIPTGQWRYYDGTLYMLGLLQVAGAFKLYY